MSSRSMSHAFWSSHEGVSVWTAQDFRSLNNKQAAALRQALDDLGNNSARAQGLPHPITSASRLKMASVDTRVYIYTCDGDPLGILKCGTKRLYVRTRDLDLREIEPLCVLDFYVSKTHQRQGVGKQLFEYMLNHVNTHPSCLAYDRPSTKLLSFLNRHYQLNNFVPQNNNFVVFDDYWNTANMQHSTQQQNVSNSSHFMTSYKMAFSAPGHEHEGATSRTTIL